MDFDFFLSRVCVSSLLWRSRPIGDIAETMMRLNLVHLELASSHLAPSHYQPGVKNSRLFNLLAESGVRVAALRLTGMSYREKLHAIEEAGEWNIPVVLDRAEALAFPTLIDRVRTYALLAQHQGIQLLLENDFYTSCDNADAQLYLKRSVGVPAMGFAFAPLHALADSRDPADEVRALGESLRLAYLWDAPIGMVVGQMVEEFNPGPARDQAPGHGRGQVDWHDYFLALRAIKFRGILNLQWIGSDDWSSEETEDAIVRAVRFCANAADTAGFGA